MSDNWELQSVIDGETVKAIDGTPSDVAHEYQVFINEASGVIRLVPLGVTQ